MTKTMAAQLFIDNRKPFLRMTLNRPDAGNVVSPSMMQALTHQLRAMADADGYHGVVITGAGEDFCLGREPKPIAGGTTDTAHNAHASVMSVILGAYKAIRECPVPVICAVQGRAFGFGCGLAGASDLVLASDAAQFALPEMAHGIPPTLVMCALADVNRKALVDMVYSGKPVDAQTALAIGIASRVVPTDSFDEQLNELLATLTSSDEHAVRYIKGFADKPGQMSPQALSDLAGFTLATASTRPR